MQNILGWGDFSSQHFPHAKFTMCACIPNLPNISNTHINFRPVSRLCWRKYLSAEPGRSLANGA